MSKIRLEIKKKDAGETYVFKNGVAEVPGMRHKDGSPYLITLKEFNALTSSKK